MSDKTYLDYLRLFQMQLDGVLADMEKPAESLSNVFSDVMIAIIDLKNEVSTKREAPDSEALSALEDIIIQMQVCITGFQFFDAKRQRLENISDGIGSLSEYICAQSLDDNALTKKIVSTFKMEREHSIYREFLEEISGREDQINMHSK